MATNNPKNLHLPVGFRFRPTELELLRYLQSKVLGKPLPCDNVIKDNLDVYDFQDPEKLLEGSDIEDIVYVFTKLKKVCKVGGKRFDRQVGDLTWKGCDKGKKIHDKEKEKKICMGIRKNFSLKKSGIPLGYCMKEYSLDASILKDAKEELKDYVLCAIRRNKSQEKSKSTFEKSAENLLAEESKSLVNGDSFARCDNTFIPSSSGAKEINYAELCLKQVEPFSQAYQQNQDKITPAELYHHQNQYHEYQNVDTNTTSSNNVSIPSSSGAKDVELDSKVLEPSYQAYQKHQYEERNSPTEFSCQNQYDHELNMLINPYLPSDNQEKNESMDWLPFSEPYFAGNPYQEPLWSTSNEGFVHPEVDWIMGDLASEMAISNPLENSLHTRPTLQHNYPFLISHQQMLIDSSEPLLTQMVPLAMIHLTDQQKPTDENEMMKILKTTEITPSKITPPAKNCEVPQKCSVRTSNKKENGTNPQSRADFEDDADRREFGSKLGRKLLEFP